MSCYRRLKDEITYKENFEKGFQYFHQTHVVDMEGLAEVFSTIGFQFKRIYDSINQSILNAKQRAKLKQEVKRLEEVDQLDYLSDDEVNDLAHSFFRLIFISALNRRNPNYLFTMEGKLRDLDEIMRKTRQAITDIVTTIEENQYLDDINEMSRVTEYIEREFVLLDEGNFRKIRFTKDSIFAPLMNFPEQYEKAHRFYEKETKELQKLVKVQEKRISQYQQQLNERLVSKEEHDKLTTRCERIILLIHHLIKVAYIPASIMIGYIRLISYLSSAAVDVKYTTTTKVPYPGPLYHLSEAEQLPEIMAPRIGGTNYNEFLPERVSFAPDPLSCCYGIPRYFDILQESKRVDNKTLARELNIYEGLPIKGKTRYLKPELVAHSLNGVTHLLVKEICVVTPIKVVKRGRIRIYHKDFKLVKDRFERGRYLSWEWVEKY